jgi:hypothetical protein
MMRSFIIYTFGYPDDEIGGACRMVMEQIKEMRAAVQSQVL